MTEVRQIVLDTETTGLSPERGDKIIEIGCVELLGPNHRVGETYHVYVDPQRQVSTAAFNIHGISTEFLKGKPTFSDIAKDFLNFIGNSPLVIHNAAFDVNFINYELQLLGHPGLANHIIDTLLIARKKFPGSPASLDALCKRFDISLEIRKKNGHGARLDAELLAMVYNCLRGISQNTLNFIEMTVDEVKGTGISRIKREKRKFEVSAEEERMYLALRERLTNII